MYHAVDVPRGYTSSSLSTIWLFRCRNFIWNYFFNQILYKTIIFHFCIFKYRKRYKWLNMSLITNAYEVDSEKGLLEIHKVRMRRKKSKCSKICHEKSDYSKQWFFKLLVQLRSSRRSSEKWDEIITIEKSIWRQRSNFKWIVTYLHSYLYSSMLKE